MSNETQTETMDEKYAEAVALCEKEGRVSVELIKRKLSISGTRAAKIVEAIKANAAAKPVEETAGGATVVTDAPADVSADDYRSQEYDDGEPAAAPTVPDVLAAANLVSGEHDLPVALIRESEKNTRTDFGREGLLLLSDTLVDEQIGQVKPIDVYRLDEPDANGCVFELLDGARRFRAAKLGERTHIRARIVPAGTEADRLVRRLMANTGEPLNPIDLGEACVHLLKHCNGDKKRAAKLAGFGEDGVRVFEQTMQRVTDLIPPVLQALRDGRITKSHADLLCRVDAKCQKEALAMCFEARPIFNGATGENEEILISEKELRGKIAMHFPKDDGQKQGKLFDTKSNVGKDANDITREHQQRMEEEGSKILEEGGAGEESESDSPSVSSEATANGSASVAAVSETPKEQEPSDYEKQHKERILRVAAAIGRLDDDVTILNGWGVRIARILAAGHIDGELFANIYGAPMLHQAGNRITWPDLVKEGERCSGTISEFIDYLDVGCSKGNLFARIHLRKLLVVLVVLPAHNPAYPDDAVKALEEFYKPVKKSSTPKAQRSGPDAKKNATRGTPGAAASSAKKPDSVKKQKVKGIAGAGKEIAKRLKQAAKESDQIRRLSVPPTGVGRVVAKKLKPKSTPKKKSKR